MTYKRILILGMSGAGKSTLARTLGKYYGLPVTHLDNLAHHPGWTTKSDDTIRRLFTKLAKQPTWVADGNYLRLSAALRQRADLIIFLDFGTLFCLGQILKRWALHKLGIQRRFDLQKGLDDAISWPFLQWVWQWRRNNRPRWQAVLAKLPASRVKVLGNRREARKWLRQLKAGH